MTSSHVAAFCRLASDPRTRRRFNYEASFSRWSATSFRTVPLIQARHAAPHPDAVPFHQGRYHYLSFFPALTCSVEYTKPL